MAQKPFVRIPAPPNEQRYQRRHRERRETDGWMQMVEQVGKLAFPSVLVHVGDRTADRFPFFRACLAHETHFVVRAAQNRRIQAEEQEIDPLLDLVRTWPSQDQQPFKVRASHGRIGRDTTLQISLGQASILPPWNDPRGSKTPFAVWAVRVWEEEAPEGEEALEWIWLTDLPTRTPEQAWLRVSWYRCRWVVQDDLKSAQNRMSHRGTTPAHSRAVDADARVCCLQWLCGGSQLRDLSRKTPDCPASQVLEAEAVAIIAARSGQSSSTLTVGAFWIEVARMGG